MRIRINHLTAIVIILMMAFVVVCYAENENNIIVPMIESKTITVSFDVPEGVTPDSIKWTLGGKDFEDWKKFESMQYQGASFITVNKMSIENGTAEAKILFTPVYEQSWMLIQFPAYLNMIGTYDLTAKAGETVLINVPVTLLPFASYVSYDMLPEVIADITSEAAAHNDRFLLTESIGQSAEGRDILMSVVAKNEETIQHYQDELLPEMLNHPADLQSRIQEGELKDNRLPVMISCVHPNEAPNTAAILQLFRILALEDDVPFQTENTKSSGNLDIDKLLDELFFVLIYTANPDGLANGSRSNADYVDLNRDSSYQTQPETRSVAAQLARWTPITYLDLHGFDDGFLIEPAMPPHDPNLELDLLMDQMLEQGRVMGTAAISNTVYTSFYIPYEEYLKSLEDPEYNRVGEDTSVTWDDLSPNYAASFAAHHGALGFTMEIPDFAEESVKALVYACLGGADHIAAHKDELFQNQLEIFRRGVENIDSPDVDPYLINAQGEIIGRLREENGNFFPEYYVLPVDEELQRNPLEAYRMISHLLRNGLKVERLTADIQSEDVVYPAGSFIVSMHQAKRSLVNTWFFEGIDVSDFAAISDPFVQCFQNLRGFDLYEVCEEDIFDGKTEAVTEIQIPAAVVPETTGNLLLRNSNSDAIRAVNSLLNEGKTVVMLTSGKFSGNFVVSAEDIAPYAQEYYVDLEKFTGIPEGKVLRPVTVTAYGDTSFMLRSFGFEVSDETEGTDVHINTWEAEEALDNGIPYIAFGNYSYGLSNLAEYFEDFSFSAPDWERYEGLFRVELDQDDPITATFRPEETFYTMSGAYITEVPDGAEILAQISSDKDFFLAGWWPGHEQARGQILAFEYIVDGKSIAVFANDLTASIHSQHQARLLANMIFSLTGR